MTYSPWPDVSLRPLRVDDWPSIHEWSQLEDVYRYQVWGPNTSNVVTQRFVETAINDGATTPRTRYVWSAVLPEQRVVGIGELRVHDARSGRAEVSYVVHPDHWRRGYATQMASWIVDFAFSELDLHRVEGTCDPRNVASAAVLRKVGMTYEGRARENVKIRDGWRDSELFGILENEWHHRVRSSLPASPPNDTSR